jgi:UDP-N-acetylmuramoyl-L-alanyl-D-glutamate--2,6-diaminopimelate ligase
MILADFLSLPSVLGYATQLNPDLLVLGLTDDSRKVKPGFIFIAKMGFYQDGTQFIQDALQKSAIAVVSPLILNDGPTIRVSTWAEFEREALSLFYGAVESKMRFVGITGTKGKTSTAFFMYDFLQRHGEAVCYIGTIGIYDRQRQIARNKYTTPDAYTLYQILAEKVAQGHGLCVMEVSSHALSQLRINGLRFAAAGFTNLSHDHLDYHKTMEEYFAAKETLFTEHLSGQAVINCADPWGKRLYNGLSPQQRLGFGTGADVQFTWQENQNGAEIDIPGCQIFTGMPGFYNVENAVLAALLLRAIGYQYAEYRLAMNGIPGRLERVQAKKLTVYIDYAHSPDSLEKVLNLLSSRKQHRLITVFGCTGDRDRTKRPIMAAIAEKYSDYTIVTSDDPHSEEPTAICREVVKGFSGLAYKVEPDRRQAIALALAFALPGDIILVAGKGHEIFQVFADYEIPFSDRQVVEELLGLVN